MLFNIFFKSFFKKNFAKRKNISTFAENSDNEPTALATDVGKPIVLSGKSAEDFERRMHEVEKKAEYRRLHFSFLIRLAAHSLGATTKLLKKF